MEVTDYVSYLLALENGFALKNITLLKPLQSLSIVRLSSHLFIYATQPKRHAFFDEIYSYYDDVSLVPRNLEALHEMYKILEEPIYGTLNWGRVNIMSVSEISRYSLCKIQN